MKKILWSLFVVLVLLVATGASADIRSDKGNTYSNDLGISAVLDSYSGDITAGGDLLVDKRKYREPRNRPHKKYKGLQFRHPGRMKTTNRAPQTRKLKQKP